MSLLQYIILFVVLAGAFSFAAYVRIASSQMTRSQMEALRRQEAAIKGIYEPEDHGKH
jgi:hypothetical protein